MAVYAGFSEDGVHDYENRNFSTDTFRLHIFYTKTESHLGRCVESVNSKEPRVTDNRFCLVFGYTERDAAENRQKATFTYVIS